MNPNPRLHKPRFAQVSALAALCAIAAFMAAPARANELTWACQNLFSGYNKSEESLSKEYDQLLAIRLTGTENTRDLETILALFKKVLKKIAAVTEKAANKPLSEHEGEDRILKLQCLTETAKLCEAIQSWAGTSQGTLASAKGRPFLELFYEADEQRRSLEAEIGSVRELRRLWADPPSAPPRVSEGSVDPQVRSALVKLTGVQGFLASIDTLPGGAVKLEHYEEIENRLAEAERQTHEAHQLEEKVHPGSDLSAYYKRLLDYIQRTRRRLQELKDARLAQEDIIHGLHETVIPEGQLRAPLSLMINFTVPLRNPPDPRFTDKKIQGFLQGLYPDFNVSVAWVKKTDLHAVTFTPKDPSSQALGSILVDFIEGPTKERGRYYTELNDFQGPAVAGMAFAKADFAMRIARRNLELTEGSGLFQTSIPIHFEEKFRIAGTLLVQDAKRLPYSVTAWSQGQRQCRDEGCPHDHHVEDIYFHSKGDSVLEKYEDPDSVFDLLDQLSVGVGPLSIDSKGLKISPSMALGPVSVGTADPIYTAKFKPVEALKTPGGGAFVSLGYSVHSVRDGQETKQDSKNYKFFSAVGLKQGQNQVRTESQFKRLLTDAFGSQEASSEAKDPYPSVKCPGSVFETGYKIGACFNGAERARIMDYKSTESFNRTSVLVNRVTYLLVDVSLAFHVDHLKKKDPGQIREIPLYLNFCLWPRLRPASPATPPR